MGYTIVSKLTHCENNNHIAVIQNGEGQYKAVVDLNPDDGTTAPRAILIND